MGMDQTTKFCPICRRQTLWGRPGTNHVLHLLLTLFLCGFWLPIWVLASIRIGGWRCQTCGYKGSAGARFALPILCIGLFIVFLVAVANYRGNRGHGGSPASGVQHAESQNSLSDQRVKSDSGTDVVDAEQARREEELRTERQRQAEERHKAAEEHARVEKGERAAADAARWRTWTDTSGEHMIEAKFDGVAFGKVKLIKRDGSTVQVPLEKLSDSDQAWIKEKKWKTPR